tara:strand:+ start:15133 stop:15408 length:276 start_codon:yes stop_codon:yes gene_type:complete
MYLTTNQKTYILNYKSNSMVKRKIGNSHTTICISWVDKDDFRRFAKLVKKTKNGDMYESDSVVFHRMLSAFKNVEAGNENPHETYPRKNNV